MAPEKLPRSNTRPETKQKNAAYENKKSKGLLTAKDVASECGLER